MIHDQATIRAKIRVSLDRPHRPTALINDPGAKHSVPSHTIFDPRDNLSRVGPSLNPSLRPHVGENHKYLNARGTNRNGSFRIWGLWKPWKSTKDVRISTVPTSPRNARRGQNGFEPRLAGTSAGTSKEMGNKMRFLFDRSHPLRK